MKPTRANTAPEMFLVLAQGAVPGVQYEQPARSSTLGRMPVEPHLAHFESSGMFISLPQKAATTCARPNDWTKPWTEALLSGFDDQWRKRYSSVTNVWSPCGDCSPGHYSLESKQDSTVRRSRLLSFHSATPCPSGISSLTPAPSSAAFRKSATAPSERLSHFPTTMFTFHSLIVLSMPPEASVLPSGLYAKHVPGPTCPLSVACSLPVVTSHSLNG
jgi:hypothetical protein